VTDEILVLVENEAAVTRGGRESWKSIKTKDLVKSFGEVTENLSSMVAASETNAKDFEVTKLEVTLGITASGTIGLFGTGAEAKADAGIKLTFERKRS